MKLQTFSLSALTAAFLFLFACHKNNDQKSGGNEIYIASPEKIMIMAGSPWSTVKPDLEHKKGYWYTDFSNNSDIPVQAAVSLPAVEETNPEIGYQLSFNTSRGNEIVGGVGIETDSLTQLSFEAVAALMQEYFNRSLPLMGDTISTYATYVPPGGVEGTDTRKTSIPDLLERLANGMVSEACDLNAQGTEGTVWIHFRKDATGTYYEFSCQSF